MWEPLRPQGFQDRDRAGGDRTGDHHRQRYDASGGGGRACTKATKRNLSLKIFDFQDPESVGGNRVKQVVKLRKGLSQEIAKKLSKIVRDELKKVTVAIQGESVRITGKSKDDLQLAIQLVKSKEDELDVPLQFENYR